MPRFLERDEGIRHKPCEKYPWDGVGDVRPFSGFATPVVEGVYFVIGCMVGYDLYKPNRKPIVPPSFSVVSDLLGVTDRVRSRETEEASNELCQRIHDLLSDFKKQVELDQDWQDWHPWSYVQFSDTIVLGYPIRQRGDYGEPELGEAASFVQHFQTHMSLGGFLVRGGLSFGELHISRDHCFGKALVAAHLIENCKARFPRIVASPQVNALVDQHLGFYSDSGQAPQASQFLRDRGDGSVFVNYLDWSNLGEGTDLPTLKAHKKVLLAQRDDFSGDNAVTEKLDWAMGYHNFFCENQIVGTPDWEPSRTDKEDLKIDTGVTDRFERLAERSSSGITTKFRMPGAYEWPSFDE